MQHLDISIIGDDPIHAYTKPGSQILQHMKAETERANLKADERDFKNKNLKPEKLLLRPNRSRVAEFANTRARLASLSHMVSQLSLTDQSANKYHDLSQKKSGRQFAYTTN